ncbi:Cupin_7 domain-containing protein [Durusdinium trenchii]|uniref:Cupin_7 domain-containing protein n=1 Tax=Durusdinium trenchii TaxID=1381693 RepID=A0ABP0IWV2_9DINO
MLLKATSAMPWTASPSPSVVRKRLELLGAAESGRVTSVVRYARDSSFPEHGHPLGEEIFVLGGDASGEGNGCFSDQTGDFGPGWYILNDEGFAHSPFSKEGCTIFVKLKQYSGKKTVRIDTNDEGNWKPTGPGVSICELFRDQEGGLSDEMDLVRIEPEAEMTVPPQPNGLELFVTKGGLDVDGSLVLDKGTWLKHESTTEPTRLRSSLPSAPVTVYVKKAHLTPAPEGNL